VTGRAAAIQGGLAALGLVTAYFTWQRDAEIAPGAVTVIDAGKTDVSRIHYEDENTALDLWRPGREKTVWVHLLEKPKTPAKDDKAAAKDKDKKDPPKEKAPPPARDLLGSEGALSLYEKFTPLVSPRTFGVLDASKLKEIGLDPPKRKLVVSVKGGDRTFEIGQPASGGAGESFLRDTRDGKVYLMPRGVTPELQNGGHMVDRKLHTFDTGDYDHITVTVGDKKKDYVHVGKESITTEGFASAKTPDKRDQMAKNWHDSLGRLFPMEVLGKGENPPEGTPKVVLRVDYFDRKDSVGFLELAKVETAPAPPAMSESGSPPPAAPQPDLYVRTEHSVGWMKVHSGLASVVTDAEKIIAAP
jgi:hypothetical protein